MARYRLLGLDVDGSLLDPAGQLPDDAREAVAEARRRGLEVVLCTGRRLRTALPVARALELEGAIVVNNGVLVKELATGRSLRRTYLPRAIYPEVLGLLKPFGSPLVYVDEHPEEIDILIEEDEARTHPFQREYLDDNTAVTRRVRDLAAQAAEMVIMVSLMGDDALLSGLARRALDLGERIRTQRIVNKNYRGHILEFLAPGSGKWNALRWVAARAGVGPEAVAAVGDDVNDVDMLAGAGLGIAMGNAAPEALEASDRTVPGNDAAGVVRAIELVLKES
jgi:Cof subfamily protein (haloacid dehalogenase superfamily)